MLRATIIFELMLLLGAGPVAAGSTRGEEGMLVERKWYMPSLSGGNILIFHRDHTLRVEGSGGEDEFEGNGTWSLDGDTLRLRYSFHIVGSSAQPSRIVDECKLIRISSTDLVVSHRYRGERSMATYRVLNR